jgi:hypothetical protein
MPVHVRPAQRKVDRTYQFLHASNVSYHRQDTIKVVSTIDPSPPANTQRAMLPVLSQERGEETIP